MLTGSSLQIPEKINIVDKPLARLIREKETNVQTILGLKNDKRLYANMFENLDEMDKFSEKCDLSKVTQEDYPNSPIIHFFK